MQSEAGLHSQQQLSGSFPTSPLTHVFNSWKPPKALAIEATLSLFLKYHKVLAIGYQATVGLKIEWEGGGLYPLFSAGLLPTLFRAAAHGL